MIPDLRQSPQRMDSLWLCTAFHCFNQGWDRCAADLDQRVDGCTPFLDEDREPALMHATKSSSKPKALTIIQKVELRGFFARPAAL
jgi:hypothetical protein